MNGALHHTGGTEIRYGDDLLPPSSSSFQYEMRVVVGLEFENSVYGFRVLFAGRLALPVKRDD